MTGNEDRTERLPLNYQTKECSAIVSLVCDTALCMYPEECKYKLPAGKHSYCVLAFNDIKIDAKSGLEKVIK